MRLLVFMEYVNLFLCWNFITRFDVMYLMNGELSLTTPINIRSRALIIVSATKPIRVE